MIKQLLPALIFIAALSSLLIPAISAKAQDKKDTRTLEEILKPKRDLGNGDQPLTPMFMANVYYKDCTSEEHLFFSKDELKIMCGCNAAKMSQFLTVKDFQDMPKKNKRGRNARGKMLAHAYAPCMEFAIDEKVKKDCTRSKYLRNIASGKRLVCGCVANRFKNIINRTAPTIIMNALHHNPMTLDPLLYYFTHKDYLSMQKMYTKQCVYEYTYERDN